jgi:hypothetical protein
VDFFRSADSSADLNDFVKKLPETKF